MKRRNPSPIIIALCGMLLFSMSVLAAGSSGGGYTAPPLEQDPEPAPEEQTKAPVDCESKGIMADRIRCRLTEGKEMYGVHESCRGLANEADCGRLYKNVVPCYVLEGQDKDRCFKNQAGVSEKRISNATDKSGVRTYMLFLLYDLEERAEAAYENETITADAATDLIISIINIKQGILKGENKADIKAGIASLKSLWQEEMGDV